MKFEQYSFFKERALAALREEGRLPDVGQMNPIVLAYVGDGVFSLYFRLRLLHASSHVRVLHDLDARMVSAKLQALAMDELEADLSEEERLVVQRGRNAKSTVPRSATVREYRQATALEALVGWLFLLDRQERLEEVLQRVYTTIAGRMQAE